MSNEPVTLTDGLVKQVQKNIITHTNITIHKCVKKPAKVRTTVQCISSIVTHNDLQVHRIEQQTELRIFSTANMKWYKKAVLSWRWPRDARYLSRWWAVAKIWPFEIIQDGDAAILNLFESKIAPLDPPSPKTPPRTKHEVDRITRCRDMAIRVYWGHMEPPFGGKGRS